MQSIPPSLSPFFQEYDIVRLSSLSDSATIIERTLRFGTRLELKWLFQTFSRKQIRDWVIAWGGFALPEPHLTFWKLILNIKEYND